LSSYAIGILLGYGITTEYELPMKWRRLAWWFSTVLFIGIMWIPIHFYEGLEFQGSRTNEIILGSFFKAGCSAGLGGLLFMCWTEPDSWLARRLSAKIFTPISRISYSMFMTHPFLIIFLYGMQREPFYLSHLEVFTKSIYLVLASLVVGYVTFITVEAPFFNLVKQLLAPKKITISSDSNNNDQMVKQQLKKKL